MTSYGTEAEHRKFVLRKRAVYMKLHGKPLHVTPAEMDEVRTLCVDLYERGMSSADIGKSVDPPICDTTVLRLLKGVHKTVHRTTYNRLLQVKYVDPKGKVVGATRDATGMVRRLQALFALGFNSPNLANLMGCSADATRQLLDRRTRTFVHTHTLVASVYDKLQYADPCEYGGTQRTINLSKGIASRNDWAPPMCWDEDTIDDPNAIPEWTGECGTNEGFWLHRKYGIPICTPCLMTGKDYDPPHDPRFNRKLFKRTREEAGWNIASLGRKSGVDPSTISSWEKGKTRPRSSEKLFRISTVFDVDPEIFFSSE